MRILLVGLALISTAPASAEVVSSNANGFEIRHRFDVPAAPAKAYAAFGQVDRWWSKDHTYSGDASRLSLSLRPGGCFCEKLDGDGGIEHLRVTYVQPDQRAVLTGSLGPLLYQATAGVMDVQFEALTIGTRVTITYRAAGFAKGGAAQMAPVVDKVLGEQAAGLKAFASR